MSKIPSNGYWVLDTRGVDPTLVIAMSFIFISYLLHPIVESAYKRARACSAWRTIEKGQSVEVTSYPMLAEVFGARRNWDAGRITTILLALFSLVSWGLELSMGVANIEGLAYDLNQSPPVELGTIDGQDVWLVKSREELDYDGVWEALPNMFPDHAKSRYYMDDGGRHSGKVNGNIIVASWYTEPDETLFYYTGGNATIVAGLQCADNVAPNVTSVYHEGGVWGSAIECGKGPRMTSDVLVQCKDTNVAPPVIVMTRSDGKVFIVVEENGSSTSFLYSIWTIGSVTDTSAELIPEFHIASTMRLAEAVVTGIVQGETSGGGCVGLLRKFSETRQFCENYSDAERALLFGERPSRDIKANIQDMEILRLGLKLHAGGFPCLVCLIVLTSIGLTWSIFMHSSVAMDIYDKNELVRMAVLRGLATGDTEPSTTYGIQPSVTNGNLTSATQIYVRKGDTGNISVVVNDANDPQRRCSPTFWSVLLALVSMVSWGLEIPVNLALHAGEVDLLSAPPPVILLSTNGSHLWQVLQPGCRDCDEHWNGSANPFLDHGSSYTADNGDIAVAHWYAESDEGFFHNLEDLATAVGDLECTD